MKDEKKNIKKEIEDKKIEKEAEKKEEPITINLPGGGTRKIYPASPEYDAAKKGELKTSKSDSSTIPDITNIKKNEKGDLSGETIKPKVSAMGVDVKKIENDTKIDIEKNTNPSGKVIPKPTNPLMKNSPAAKAGIPLDMRQKFANQNAAFQATKNKDSGYTKMDFIKDFPSSQTAKKFNKGERIPGFSYKKNLKNSYEPYDLVLDYVLSEGHADTVEEAHYVMMQMDEGTIQTIVEFLGGRPGDGYLGHPNLDIKNPFFKGKRTKGPVLNKSNADKLPDVNVNKVGAQMGDYGIKMKKLIDEM